MQHAMQPQAPHPMAGRNTWGGLNVAYETQQPEMKPR